MKPSEQMQLMNKHIAELENMGRTIRAMLYEMKKARAETRFANSKPTERGKIYPLPNADPEFPEASHIAAYALYQVDDDNWSCLVDFCDERGVSGATDPAYGQHGFPDASAALDHGDNWIADNIHALEV